MLGQFAPICKVYNSHSDIHDSPVKSLWTLQRAMFACGVFHRNDYAAMWQHTSVCVCVSDKASLSWMPLTRNRCNFPYLGQLTHVGLWVVCSLLQLYSECQQGELCEIVKTSCKKKSILWTYNGGIFGQWRVKRVVNGTINVDGVLSSNNTVKLLNWKLLLCKLDFFAAENVADRNMGEYICVFKIIAK